MCILKSSTLQWTDDKDTFKNSIRIYFFLCLISNFKRMQAECDSRGTQQPTSRPFLRPLLHLSKLFSACCKRVRFSRATGCLSKDGCLSS